MGRARYVALETSTMGSQSDMYTIQIKKNHGFILFHSLELFVLMTTSFDHTSARSDSKYYGDR